MSVHLVLSGRTRGLVGAPELAIMKPTAHLVNTSRGPIVVEADLIAALKAQKIAGAAIDVFDQEPLPLDHPFRSLSNLLATPHIGYVSRDLYARFYQDTGREHPPLAQRLGRFRHGETLRRQRRLCPPPIIRMVFLVKAWCSFCWTDQRLAGATKRRDDGAMF